MRMNCAGGCAKQSQIICLKHDALFGVIKGAELHPDVTNGKCQ